MVGSDDRKVPSSLDQGFILRALSLSEETCSAGGTPGLRLSYEGSPGFCPPVAYIIADFLPEVKSAHSLSSFGGWWKLG